MAFGQLVNGKWPTEWTERNENRQFQRMSTQFHDWETTGLKGKWVMIFD